MLFYFGYLSILWNKLSSNLSRHYRRFHLTKIPWIILDSLPINSTESLFTVLITCPIIPFKLLQGFFCVTFEVPFNFPYHCYLTKCSQIFFKKFRIFFLFSSLLCFGLTQLPLLHYPNSMSYFAYLYLPILFISLLSPYLLKLYYYSVLCQFLRIRTLDNLVESLVADAVSCAEEKSWCHEKIAKFRSEIGMLSDLSHFIPTSSLIVLLFS
jgi:hypothetical protein